MEASSRSSGNNGYGNRNIKQRKREKVVEYVAKTFENSDTDEVDEINAACQLIDKRICSKIVSATSIQSLGETIRSTLLEIHETCERNRERRHKELLLVLSKFIDSDTIHEEDGGKQIVNNHASGHKEKPFGISRSSLQSGLRIGTVPDLFIADDCSSSAFLRLQQQRKSVDNASNNVALLQTKCLQIQTEANESIKNSHTGLEGCSNKGGVKLTRTQMLEIQRKKMEDRERRSRSCLQTHN
uniref:Uncharacterized protein n=1 Tax=Stomoxys calcitrans TaxID=35570 RepID=A0A1I8NNS6_STOCA